MSTEPDWQTFLETVIVSDNRDWSEKSTDAWIFGIVVGWDEEIDRVARQHSWTPVEVYRLEQYRHAFAQSKGDHASRLATLEANYKHALNRIRLSELAASSHSSEISQLQRAVAGLKDTRDYDEKILKDLQMLPEPKRLAILQTLGLISNKEIRDLSYAQTNAIAFRRAKERSLLDCLRAEIDRT